MEKSLTAVEKGGRCWNGFHKDRGTVVHLIEGEEPNGFWGGKALCGTEPGIRSSGWSRAMTFINRQKSVPKEVTCTKCKKIKDNTKTSHL